MNINRTPVKKVEINNVTIVPQSNPATTHSEEMATPKFLREELEKKSINSKPTNFRENLMPFNSAVSVKKKSSEFQTIKF